MKRKVFLVVFAILLLSLLVGATDTTFLLVSMPTTTSGGVGGNGSVSGGSATFTDASQCGDAVCNTFIEVGTS